MRKAITENGLVTNVIEVSDDPMLQPAWAQDLPDAGNAGPGWTWDGKDFQLPPDILPPLIIDDYRRAIDAHVEATARSRQYNSAAHMASYVASTVPEWADEATTFVAWRDQVWVAAIGMLASVDEAPAIDDVIAALPPVPWQAD